MSILFMRYCHTYCTIIRQVWIDTHAMINDKDEMKDTCKEWSVFYT